MTAPARGKRGGKERLAAAKNGEKTNIVRSLHFPLSELEAEVRRGVKTG